MSLSRLRYGGSLRYDVGLGSGDAICDELTDWVVKGGGTVDGSRCVYTPEGGGRGMQASTRLAYRQVYSVVPTSLCMYDKTIKEHSAIAGPVLTNDSAVKDLAG